ncbi:DciA family protein [Streptomyces xanthochromogenes]|uniref:DciA family protein n=1 Tax=Streptomyces xanthochromogenes TaxID=67384 RepID=UPI00344A1BA9
MTAQSELSGVDLARQALLAAQEAAKRNGAAARKPKRRTGTTVRRDGREPLGLGAAITTMMAERGMVAPAAGGSVLAQFDAIVAAAAPELAGHVQAVTFDPDAGRLDVAPDSPAYGTQLRWRVPKLLVAANERVQGAKVSTVHVLAPESVKANPATAAATSAEQSAQPVVPAERRPPPEGYRRAIEAHRRAFRSSQLDPAIAAAVERQTAAMRELSRRAFPETDVVSDDASAPIQHVRTEPPSGRGDGGRCGGTALAAIRVEPPEARWSGYVTFGG